MKMKKICTFLLTGIMLTASVTSVLAAGVAETSLSASSVGKKELLGVKLLLPTQIMVHMDKLPVLPMLANAIT